jgi:hydroxymethylpyrimidine/phosphomethylpyrimidine kinase
MFPHIRAAINMRYGEDVIRACEMLGLRIGSFSRDEEPEGMSTMEWGISTVLSKGEVDVIYDKGSIGKEPMVRLIGKNAVEVAERAVEIARFIS